MNKEQNDNIFVHAYKHNGTLYRGWENVVIIEENKDQLILINENVLITEFDGRKWITNEPAIWFFYKKKWFNVICMFKNHGIHYYCNIASPFLFEEKTIKFIDYDLDFKIFNDFSYKILDLREFNRNRMKWEYSKEIVNQVWETVDDIKKMINQKQPPFNHDYVKELWKKYKK